MRRPWQLVREMRRRRVFRTAGIYIVGAWVLLQVVALALQSFGIPESALRIVWIAAVAGLPLALLFGWRYDITADGIVRTAPPDAGDDQDLGLRNPDYIVLTAIVAIAAVFAIGALNEIRRDALDAAGPWYAAEQFAAAIAVLPLEDHSADSGQEFLVAGLHDALITTLSRITQLRVTSRFSSRRVGADMSLSEVRELLHVDKVLSGAVTRDGNQVRVNVALLDIDTGLELWSDSFTREFDGLIAMQNEVASAVAREVKVKLTPQEERNLSETRGPDSATYEAYLKGMFQLHKGTQRGYRAAIEILTEAVENDPTSALAYAGLAIGYGQLGHSPFPVAGAYPRAREAAQRALEFDPNLAEAHLAVGMYKIYYEWDFAGGEQAFLRALEINPSLVDAHYHYAWLLELLLRDEEAIEFGEYTKELNPLSPFYSAWLAEQYRDAGLHEQAIDETNATLALNPDYPIAWLVQGETLLDMGRFDEAIAAHENLRDTPFWNWAYVATLATVGREEDLPFVLDYVDKPGNSAFTRAIIYGALGDTAKALEWLEACREGKIPWFPWQVTWFDQTKFLHDDPAMQAYATDLGIEFPVQ